MAGHHLDSLKIERPKVSASSLERVNTRQRGIDPYLSLTARTIDTKHPDTVVLDNNLYRLIEHAMTDAVSSFEMTVSETSVVTIEDAAQEMHGLFGFGMFWLNADDRFSDDQLADEYIANHLHDCERESDQYKAHVLWILLKQEEAKMARCVRWRQAEGRQADPQKIERLKRACRTFQKKCKQKASYYWNKSLNDNNADRVFKKNKNQKTTMTENQPQASTYDMRGAHFHEKVTIGERAQQNNDCDVENIQGNKIVGEQPHTETARQTRHFPTVFTQKRCSKLYDFLIDNQLIDELTHQENFLYLMGCSSNCPSELKPVRWTGTKQNLRQVLETAFKSAIDSKDISKADIESLASQCFVDKKTRQPCHLAKPKQENSPFPKLIEDFFRNW